MHGSTLVCEGLRLGTLRLASVHANSPTANSVYKDRRGYSNLFTFKPLDSGKAAPVNSKWRTCLALGRQSQDAGRSLYLLAPPPYRLKNAC